jgi:hypothetical protein
VGILFHANAKSFTVPIINKFGSSAVTAFQLFTKDVGVVTGGSWVNPSDNFEFRAGRQAEIPK